MSGPSAIFGRAPVKRIPVIREANGDTREDGTIGNGSSRFDYEKDPPKTKAELKVRVVQHEIAEKEACKMLQGLCQELSVISRVDVGGSSYNEIQDLLSGILLLGNLCKRVVLAKNEIEKSLSTLKGDLTSLEQTKKAAIEQLEGVILRLQGENIKATDMVTELNTKHNHKTTLMQKEMFTLREYINELKTENEKLTTKLQFQERKVMDIPRLEEQYLRTARSIVRQQEVANTMNKIEFKKVEEEVKNMNFFKNKAKFLEENLEKVKAEVENLTNQNRLAHSRYQALLLDFNKFKTSKQLEHTKSKVIKTPANSHVMSAITTGKLLRPASAPAIRTSASGISLPAESSNKAQSINTPEVEDNGIGEESHDGSSLQKKSSTNNNTLFRRTLDGDRSKRPVGSAYKSTEDLLNEEIVKLHAEIQKKDQQILKMTKKLSLARAYPLLATQERDEYDIREDSKSRATDSVGKGFGIAWDYEDGPMKKSASLNSSAPNIGYLVGNNLHDMNYMMDELESVSTSFRLEEETLQEERNRKAVALQLEFNDRFSKHRQNLPPHIAAIRHSKSFVKVLDDENLI